ncbi:MAG: alpha/beta fold hydrolase, partial [Flavisolibacter sp.]
AMEKLLQKQPTIRVPAVILDAELDGVEPLSGTGKDARYFTGGYERRIIKGVGHNLPQEAPGEFARAVLKFIDL